MTPRAVRAPGPDDLDRAWRAVSAALEPTPLVPSPGLAPGALLKLETCQPTGSFKVRGALAAVAALPDGAPAVTASAGNHGLGMGHAAAKAGADVTVVVSTRASRIKVEKIAAFPVRLVEHGLTYDQAEAHALTLPGRFVSPYNDPDVIAGQGTIGRELDAQAAGPLTVVAPVGGGGLLAGLCLWARERGDVRVVGVESAVSRGVSASVAAGRTVEVPVGETFADGLPGNLEPGCVTPEVIGDTAALTAVTDDQIRTALRWLLREHGLVAEGAGAAGVAAVLAGEVAVEGRLAVVVSGRNITVPGYADAIREN
ncbi:pyridoxal-phosphate dependent enzyme [Actinomadura sp. NAK00032]|uniref:threonine ammonia-lyase n=1 Tax=Actinomadura sp. NAK00032 TaxID=2742128 RepID=UPI0015925E82|nr:pyridoxal-phosphate dependent enzyme [Actinomadura sp. NAK00032]QKW37394.1 pyridoxal-phosphate dependent enzyme [Actinomadura sp. NAK00032]